MAAEDIHSHIEEEVVVEVDTLYGVGMDHLDLPACLEAEDSAYEEERAVVMSRTLFHAAGHEEVHAVDRAEAAENDRTKIPTSSSKRSCWGCMFICCLRSMLCREMRIKAKNGY